MSGVDQNRHPASKSSFDALMESSAAWFDWIDGANKFEAILKDKIPWGALDARGKEVIGKRLQVAQPASQLLLNSFYVTMVAGFEEFLRATIRELTKHVSKSTPKYADLAEDVRKLHVRESAKLLRRIDSPPDYLVFNEIDLCRGLGSCVPGSTSVTLNADAFAEVDSLIKLENFIDRANILGKEISWEHLAKQKEVKEAMKLSKDNVKRVTKALQEELATIARYRNRIAHIGGSAADVTLEIVKDHRVLLKAVSDTISSAA